ncbi:MAG: hypothetical protein IPN99_13980 [Bacteroidetes bacterium]|nr:hypothetical protein [Bacteroidota bacterium]
MAENKEDIIWDKPQGNDEVVWDVAEKKNSVPSVSATNGSLSESVNGGLGGIEPSMDNLRVMDNYVTPSGKTPQTETPQQKSERLNSALTPNAKAQKNYIVAKTKYDELISNHSANPIEVDQIAKQVDYFQSRLEKPQTKENDIADEVASVLYSFNKSVSDNVVTPIAGAINLMEDLESGGGIFKKPNRTLSKTVGDVSKYYDKVSEENQPQTIVGKTAAATASAIPLIALTTMTGAGTLPFVIGGQKALTEYGNEPNKPMSLKAEEATEALGEGIKEGLEIEASMMVGGAFGKAVSQELNLGKWGSATARGVGVGAAFALPDFAKVAVENKSLDAPDKEETFVSFATGLAFEAPKFFGLIKNAVSENKVERAAKIQNLDIYNTVFSAPLEAVSEAVEIPQSSELIYKRASSFLKKENPTNEDKIAFQALTRTAGVKDLVDVIISNPEKAKEQISSSDLTPEQKSEFRKRITEINQYFNPIEVRKTELSDEIELAQKTLSDLPEPQTPIDRAENAVLTEKLQETIKKSEQELTDLVRGQIDEAMNPKVEKDGNINLEQQVEVKSEEVKPKTEAPESGSVGVGGDVEMTYEEKKTDIEKRRQEELSKFQGRENWGKREEINQEHDAELDKLRDNTPEGIEEKRQEHLKKSKQDHPDNWGHN